MASNTLYDYYTSKGQALPSVSDRSTIASQAGISGYTGTAQQNTQLLGYLQGNPSGGNVITSDGLKAGSPITVPPVKTDPAHVGINATVGSLLDSLKGSTTTDQTTYDTNSTAIANDIKNAPAELATQTEKIIKDNGVDTLKKQSDSLSSQIEAEQKATADQIKELKANNPEGLFGGALQSKINQINSDSAERIANYGIGLSAINRQYDTASGIATRQINAVADSQKAELESRKFVLEQLGTKLATEKANAFTLQIKQIDNETSLLNNAVKTATDGLNSGTIDPAVGSKALQDLIAGKISISDFYAKIEADAPAGADGKNVGGYDITSYATDPTHEQKVMSIYNNIGDVSSASAIDAQIKAMSPKSPITGAMVLSSANKYGVDPKVILALMQQDSSMGTAGVAVRTKNAGNVGNTDSGATQTFATWGQGVDAVAQWLSKHPATASTGTDYNQVGLLSNTDYNPAKQSDKDAKFYLDQYLKTGKQPSYRDVFGYRKDGSIADAQSRADALYYQAVGSSLPDANLLTSNKKLIADNNKVLNKNEVLADTITKNFDLAINGEITNNVNTNATIVNKLLNPFYLALGNPAVNQAMVSNGTISQEFANLISIRNANGTTVSDKDVADELIKFGTSVKAQKAVVERLKAEALNIHDALTHQNAELYKQIDPLQTNPANPNRKVQVNTEAGATTAQQTYMQTHPDKAVTVQNLIKSSEKVIGRPLTALEFLQAYPEYQ